VLRFLKFAVGAGQVPSKPLQCRPMAMFHLPILPIYPPKMHDRHERRPSSYHLLWSFMRRRKFGYLLVYLAQSAPYVGFEQPTPVVVLDSSGVPQRLFHSVADVVEPPKQLPRILAPVDRSPSKESPALSR